MKGSSQGFRNKDLRKMVLDKTQEQKQRECQLAEELKKEKQKFSLNVCSAWKSYIFLYFS